MCWVQRRTPRQFPSLSSDSSNASLNAFHFLSFHDFSSNFSSAVPVLFKTFSSKAGNVPCIHLYSSVVNFVGRPWALPVFFFFLVGTGVALSTTLKGKVVCRGTIFEGFILLAFDTFFETVILFKADVSTCPISASNETHLLRLYGVVVVKGNGVDDGMGV